LRRGDGSREISERAEQIAAEKLRARSGALLDDSPVKICDLTQFYSPLSGGVKRYVHAKIDYTQASPAKHEHVLIIPDAQTGLTSDRRSRIYSIHSPLLSRTSRYRALLNLRAIEAVFERERPDLIEVGDPYQTAWKAIASGEALRIPVIGFYHSHFPEAYLRSTQKFLGKTATEAMIDAASRYVRKLYNAFAGTLVPSEQLAKVLSGWGVRNVHAVDLGVNTEVFRPQPDDRADTRRSLGVPGASRLLLYVGRLAPEKNVETLFAAFELIRRREPDKFHLMVIGDGAQRDGIRRLQQSGSDVTWLPYCTDSWELARYYRAADLFVHPGVQETFGFVALESQACGTPVIGIGGSYMDRIIFHDQASWARANTPEALADAIEELAQKKLTLIGEAAAREAAERHAWPRVFDRLFNIYREVCAGYRKGATR
jgi:alpha-1,6-mannosyltransferase